MFDLARALNVDAVETVHQNVGDGGIFEQRLQRTQAEDLVENLARQSSALVITERDGFAADRVTDNDQDFISSRVAGSLAQFFQVEAVENLAVQVSFYLLVLGALGVLQIGHNVFDRLTPTPT